MWPYGGIATLLAVALLATAPGCSGGDKVGGSAKRHVTVLHLVSFNGSLDRPLQLYADAAARRSHGSLRIEIAIGYRHGDLQAEKDTINDVRAGRAELAWVGARGWESVGIDSFRALIAPFLIDSYPLEKSVLTSSVAGPMLASLRAQGLVGLALLPGPMRRVAGRRPLRNPSDFAGVRFATTPSWTAIATLRALGARPVPLPFDVGWRQLPARGLRGLESQLNAIAGNEYFRPEPYLTSNLVLWPRPLVIFANRKVYDSLSQQDRDALRLAASDALASSTRAAKANDTIGSKQLCRGLTAGFALRLPVASPADRAALRRAVAPVYRTLERDPQTRSFIRRIEALKRRLHAPVDPGLHCGRVPSTRARRGVLDGIYGRRESAQQEARNDHVPVSQAVPENWGDFVLVIDRGRFAITQQNGTSCTWQYGTLTVKASEMDETFIDGGGNAPTNSQNKPGEFFVFRWNLYRSVLSLVAISPSDVSPQAWQRVSTTPSATALSKRCPPPRKALP